MSVDHFPTGEPRASPKKHLLGLLLYEEPFWSFARGEAAAEPAWL